MKMQKILFPTDFSASSQAAFDYAVAVAADNKAGLLIVHVEEPPVPMSTAEVYMPPASDTKEELVQMLEEIVPENREVKYEHRLLRGDPADELVRLATEESVDLIVMGTHGRTGLVRLLMGSVAEKVMRHAPCPVLTLKEPSQKEAKA